MDYLTPNCAQCKTFLDRYNYIEVNSSREDRTLEFCSWACVRKYADRKLLEDAVKKLDHPI